MANNKIIDELNDLLTRNYDAEKGYQEAAKIVESQAMKGFFIDQARNRYDFGHEVKDEIRHLGGEPNKGTSFKGDLHRGWLNLRDAISNGSEALLEECIRGENAAIEEYDEFIAKDYIPDDIKSIFTKQKSSIQQAIHRLSSMEKAVG